MSRNEWAATNLGAQASLCSKKDKSKNVSADSYVSTANMAPDFGGLSGAGVLPEGGTVTLFECGDVLFSNIRTYFRKVWKADFSGGCSNDVLVFRTKDPNHLDQGYLYHLLRWKKFTDLTVRTSKGAKMPRGDKTSMLNFEFDLPPLPEQRAIAHILGTLDDKIELNRQMSENLEEMAAALFKAWFVDFEPVKAKMEGRWKKGESLPGMPAKLYDLFPDKLVETEEGEFIPEGWGVHSLDEIADYLNGLALQKFPAKSMDDSLPVIKIAQIRSKTTKGADRASKEIKEEYIVDDGDVLFSWSGTLEVEVWNGGSGALNQHIFKVSSTKVPKWFYYLATKHHLPEFRGIARDKATTMGHIQRKHLKQAQISLCNRDLFDRLDEVIKPIFESFIAKNQEISLLSKVRNLLLPKLISGEIRVSNVEKLVKQSEELAARKKEIADQFKEQP